MPTHPDHTSPLEVAGAILLYRGRVLLTLRGPASSYAGTWECPGGKRESGETLEETARRELREEISFTAPDAGTHICAVSLEPPLVDRPICWTAFCYDVSALEARPPITLMPPASGAAWFTSDELYGLPMTPGNRTILSVIRYLCRQSAERWDHDHAKKQ